MRLTLTGRELEFLATEDGPDIVRQAMEIVAVHMTDCAECQNGEGPCDEAVRLVERAQTH